MMVWGRSWTGTGQWSVRIRVESLKVHFSVYMCICSVDNSSIDSLTVVRLDGMQNTGIEFVCK